jgi:hypothetical protein
MSPQARARRISNTLVTALQSLTTQPVEAPPVGGLVASENNAPSQMPVQKVAAVEVQVNQDEGQNISPSAHFSELQKIKAQKDEQITFYEALRTRVEALSALAVDSSLISDLDKHPSPLDEQRLTLAMHQLTCYQTELAVVTTEKQKVEGQIQSLADQARTHVQAIDRSNDASIKDQMRDLRSLQQLGVNRIQLPVDYSKDRNTVEHQLDERSKKREKVFADLRARRTKLLQDFDRYDTDLRCLTGPDHVQALKTWIKYTHDEGEIPRAYVDHCIGGTHVSPESV